MNRHLYFQLLLYPHFPRLLYAIFLQLHFLHALLSLLVLFQNFQLEIYNRQKDLYSYGCSTPRLYLPSNSRNSRYILPKILSNASNMFTMSSVALHCLAKKEAYEYALNDDSEPSIATRISDIILSIVNLYYYHFAILRTSLPCILWLLSST
jgi:hypothetical protein